jgi:two-component system, chemotaxis family, protein-glutamate methylesterase/glutaminase
MPAKDIIVIGASAGGIEALRVLLGGLPKGFPASIFIVMHISPQSPSVLADIFTRAGHLPAFNPRNYETIQPGCVYVAPPDQHMLVDSGGTIRLTHGPKENRFRPAVDPLFRSAARAFGTRVIGIILTGGLDDGTAGLWAVKQRGGLAIVQDPADAYAPSMPLNAKKHIAVDYCLPLTEIAPLLVRLTSEPAEMQGAFTMPEDLEIEVNIAREQDAVEAGILKLGEPSMFTCPECHGTLLQLKNNKNILRFRCHTGHAFSVNSLFAELNENIEDTVWGAVRAIQESVMLMQHMADHLNKTDQTDTAEAFLQKARQAQQQADEMKQLIIKREKVSLEKLKEEVS